MHYRGFLKWQAPPPVPYNFNISLLRQSQGPVLRIHLLSQTQKLTPRSIVKFTKTSGSSSTAYLVKLFLSFYFPVEDELEFSDSIDPCPEHSVFHVAVWQCGSLGFFNYIIVISNSTSLLCCIIELLNIELKE